MVGGCVARDGIVPSQTSYTLRPRYDRFLHSTMKRSGLCVTVEDNIIDTGVFL